MRQPQPEPSPAGLPIPEPAVPPAEPCTTAPPFAPAANPLTPADAPPAPPAAFAPALPKAPARPAAPPLDHLRRCHLNQERRPPECLPPCSDRHRRCWRSLQPQHRRLRSRRQPSPRARLRRLRQTHPHHARRPCRLPASTSLPSGRYHNPMRRARGAGGRAPLRPPGRDPLACPEGGEDAAHAAEAVRGAFSTQ
jgi:hypothetical protein